MYQPLFGVSKFIKTEKDFYLQLHCVGKTPKNLCLWLISVGKTQKDYYLQKHSVGKILKNLYLQLRDVDKSS